jgi:hypothetical protein
MNKENTAIRAFVKGCASAFDLTGRSYVFLPDLTKGFEKDMEALKQDWNRIGADLRHSMSTIANEQ